MLQWLKLIWILVCPIVSIAVGLIMMRGLETGFRAALCEMYLFFTCWLRKPFYRLECKIASWGKDDDYVTAYKMAFIIYDKSTKTCSFAPMRLEKKQPHEHSYSANAEAKCDKASNHKAPVKHCTCGFYALKLKRHLGKVLGSGPQTYRWRANSLAVLQVDLSGRIIPGLLGYRAEKQRVLQAQLNRRCSICYNQKPFWRRARNATSVAQHYHDGLDYILPVCEKHQGASSKDISSLQQLLQTEVVWR